MNFSSGTALPADGSGALPGMATPMVGGEACPAVAPPLLSFIVVNWNYAHFIGETLESIRAQDYSPFECIILDNGSSDDSLAVIARHIGSDERFRVIALPENRGQLGGVFVGLREAAGAFVALIDADDVLLPNFASFHIQLHLSLRSNVAITSSNVIEVDELNGALSSAYAFLRPGPQGAAEILREEAVVVRLPTISDDVYRNQLIPRVTRVPRHVGGWLWSPGTSNVMRRSIAALFVTTDDAPRMRAADNYFFVLCHAFAGTAVIDMPLSTRRIHGTNYFVRRETMPGLANGSPQFDMTMRNHAAENVEVVVRSAALHRWLLGSEFWRVLDQLAGCAGAVRRPHYRNDAIVAAFRAASADLVAEIGVAEFVGNIRLRFGLQDSRDILRGAFGGPIPLRCQLRLLPRPRWLGPNLIRRLVG